MRREIALVYRVEVAQNFVLDLKVQCLTDALPLGNQFLFAPLSLVFLGALCHVFADAAVEFLRRVIPHLLLAAVYGCGLADNR